MNQEIFVSCEPFTTLTGQLRRHIGKSAKNMYENRFDKVQSQRAIKENYRRLPITQTFKGNRKKVRVIELEFEENRGEYTPNANMADLSVRLGLVAQK